MPFARMVPRYLAAFAVAVLVIAGAQFLKGHSANDALIQGLIWGFISSTIYILAYHFNTRKTASCPVDLDTHDSKQ